MTLNIITDLSAGNEYAWELCPNAANGACQTPPDEDGNPVCPHTVIRYGYDVNLKARATDPSPLSFEDQKALSLACMKANYGVV